MMSFYDHLDDIIGMPGWELRETAIQSVTVQDDFYFCVRVKADKDTREYENSILLKPDQIIRLMPCSCTYSEAKNGTKKFIKSALKGEPVMAVYSPDKVLEGLMIK